MKKKIVLMTIWLMCLILSGFASQGKPTYVSIKGNSEASKEFFQALYLYPAYPLLKQMSIPELIEGLSRNYSAYSPSLLSASKERFLKIVEHISDQHISRNAQYYMVLEHLYRIHYKKKVEPSGYDPDVIQADLVEFDAKTQGYLRFCVLKTDLYTADERPGTVSVLMRGISDPPLLEMQDYNMQSENTASFGIKSF